jgi:hypothetical protein
MIGNNANVIYAFRVGFFIYFGSPRHRWPEKCSLCGGEISVDLTMIGGFPGEISE